VEIKYLTLKEFAAKEFVFVNFEPRWRANLKPKTIGSAMERESIMKFIIIVAVLLVTPVCSFADGSELLEECEAALDPGTGDTNVPGAMFCLGMMQGITNTNTFYQTFFKNTALFCLPERGIRNIEAARIVVKYLRDHPAELDRNESVLALSALTDAYPCKRAKP
jgi:Ssp1 endopeptidase immunity protein Rap1a